MENHEFKLTYYHSKQDANKNKCHSGYIDLQKFDWKRAYDESIDCKRFELSANNRIYLFEASSHFHMQLWLESIDLVLNALKIAIEEKVKVDMPIQVQIYEMQGRDAFMSSIKTEVTTKIYPKFDQFIPIINTNDFITTNTTNNLNNTTNNDIQQHKPLSEHIKYIEALLRYVKIELDKNIGFFKKYEIVYDGVTAVLEILQSRLSLFLDEGMPLHCIYIQAKLSDLHCLMKILIKFQYTINQIYYGRTISIPHDNKVFINALESISDRYVNGDKTTNFDGVLKHLVDNCSNVVNRFKADPAEAINRHNNGSFFTNAPLELWGILNDHLDLAAETDYPVLQVKMASKVCMTLRVSIDIISEFLSDYQCSNDSGYHRNGNNNNNIQISSNMNKTHFITNNNNTNNNLINIPHMESKLTITTTTNTHITNSTTNTNNTNNNALQDIELEMFSALANDQANHIEEVYALINKITDIQIKNHIDILYEKVIEELVDCGLICLNKLIDIVMIDINTQLNEVFTEVWLEGYQIKILIATVRDYMADFEIFLMPFWLKKFVVLLLESITLRYAKTILFRNNCIEPVPPSPSKCINNNNNNNTNNNSAIINISNTIHMSTMNTNTTTSTTNHNTSQNSPSKSNTNNNNNNNNNNNSSSIFNRLSEQFKDFARNTIQSITNTNNTTNSHEIR